MFQAPFPVPQETEEKHRFCRIWTYIVSGVLVTIALLGIALGVNLLVYSQWHESLILYKQTLVYMRRANPKQYWFFYKLFASIWIGLHALLLLSVISNFFSIRYSRTSLLIPNISVCVIHMGVYILLLAALVILSVTGTKTTWLALSIVLFYTFFVSFALIVLSLYHRFLDEKELEMKILMANTKSVHFKERKT